MESSTLSFFADDNVISAADDVVVSPSKARPASPTTPIGAERERFRIIRTLMSGNGSVDFAPFYEKRFVHLQNTYAYKLRVDIPVGMVQNFFQAVPSY